MGATTIDDVLAHYGVRGMKWGVRKRAGSGSSEPTPVLVKTKPGHAIRTAGGKNQPVAEDAIKVASARQKARASGPQSLSNAEMKMIVERMNLESQYSKLNPRQKSLGEKFIQEALKSGPGLALDFSKSKYKDVLDPKNAAFNPTIARRIALGELFARFMKK